MNVTRDVILDLLPLCHAGEASDDTHNLVAAFAAQDPEIARLLAAPPAALPETNGLDKETEMKTLEKTKSYLKWQTVLLGGASFLSFCLVLVMALIPAVMFFVPADSEQSRFFLTVALIGGLVVGFMAAAAWTAYLTFRSVYRIQIR